MQITEALTAARSPWQNPYVERLIGSIRRECLDHVIVMNESSLRRQIACYLDYLSRLAESSFAWEGLSRCKSGGTAGTGPNCRRGESRPASPSIPTPSRINSLPPVTSDQRENSAGMGLHGGAKLTDRAPS